MLKDFEIDTKAWQLGIIDFEKHQFNTGELDNNDTLNDITDDLFAC